MNNKALGHDQNDAVRGLVRRVIARDFEGNNSAAAKAFGVSPSLLSEFLGTTRGAGMKLLRGLQNHLGVSLDDILVGGEDSAPTARRMPVFGRLPGWQAAEAEARELLPGRPEWVWEGARQVSGVNCPPVADVALVLKAVALVKDYPPHTPGDSAETTAVKAEIAALTDRASKPPKRQK